MLSVFSLPRTALSNKDMLRSFVWRDVVSRYDGSMLGRLWPLIYPLLLLGIYHLVFAEFLGLKFGGKNPIVGEKWEVTFYMLSGILPWLAFADTLTRGTNVVVENSNLIKKIAFPSELLPTCVSITHLIHFLISVGFFLALYVVISLTSDEPSMLMNLIYLPIPIAVQFLFGLGLAMMLSTINVFARDLGQVMPIGLLLWMLVSPIFYPIAMVDRKVNGYEENGVWVDGSGETWMLTVMEFNPIFHLLEMYRAVFRVDVEHAFPWDSCAILTGISLVLLALGHALFVRAKGLFADEV